MEKNDKIKQFLSQVDELKCIYTNRDLSFIPFAFHGFHYSEEKATVLIDRFIEILKTRYLKWEEALTDETINFYSSFFHFTILFCDVQCNRNDFIFESFLKLSKTIVKPEKGKSTADILVEDINNSTSLLTTHKKEVTLLNKYYNYINKHYTMCYDEYFENNVRHMVNEFLDSNGDSILMDDELFVRASRILSQTIHRIKRLRDSKQAVDKNNE